MSAKPRVFLWTDCYFFGGCENLLVTLLRSPRFHEQCEVHARYRYSNIYRAGAEARGLTAARLAPVSLPTFETTLSMQPAKATANASLRRMAAGVSHLLLRRTGFEALYGFVRLAVGIKRFKADAVVINNGGYPGALSCRMAALAAGALGVPVVFVVNNVALPARGLIDRVLDALVCACVTRFVTASGYAAVALRRRLGINHQDVVCIANCLPADRFLAIDGRPEPARRRDESTVSILGVAHLEHRKGYHVLLQAARLLHADHALRNSFRVTIIGDGPERTALERQVAELGLRDVASLPGPREDFPRFLDDADIFCLPSIAAEDMPYSLIEAMFLGKPIVSTEVSGIPELLGHGRYGVVVPANDAAALARALRTLMESVEERRVLGDAARQRALEAHSPAACVQAYIGIIDAAVKAKSAMMKTPLSDARAIQTTDRD